MMFGTIIVTIAFKGMSNIMLSLIILLYNLQKNEDLQQFKIAEDKLDYLMHEMQMQEAKQKASKVTNG